MKEAAKNEPPKGEDLIIQLTSNPTVVEIAERISTTPIDWNTLKQSALDELFEHRGSYNVDSLIGRLAEIHVASVIGSTDNEKVAPFVLEDGIKNGKFQLAKKPNDTIVAKKPYFNFLQFREEVTDYDGLILCDSLPTVIEVKASMAKGNDAMHRRTINRKFLPLTHNLQTRTFAYIAVFLAGSRKESDTTRGFIENGGILVALPGELTTDALRQQAQTIHQEYKTSQPRAWTFE